MIEINPGILIAQVITFIVALAALWKIAWGPLTQMMREREESIRNNIDKAGEERRKAEELKRSYEDQLAQSHLEAQKLIAQASGDGQREREKIVAAARGEAEKVIENARRQLADEKDRLVKELRSDVADIAVRISEKLIEKSIDKSVQDKVFRDMVDKLGASQKENRQ